MLVPIWVRVIQVNAAVEAVAVTFEPLIAQVTVELFVKLGVETFVALTETVVPPAAEVAVMLVPLMDQVTVAELVTMGAAIKASAAKTVAAARIRLRVSELMACLPRFPHHLLRRLFRLVHHR